MKMFIGVDPGMSGGVAFMDHLGLEAIPFKLHTPHDLVGFIETRVALSSGPVICFLEAVNAMPKQGVSSTFKFGVNYGWWQGVLTALGIPFRRVYPLKWQTAMSCRTGGNKNITKARAQELFPGVKITHAVADAILIAEYGRRQTNLNTLDDL